MTQQTTIGIDDMALYVPALYLELSDLATARGIAYEKLKHGLGLERMAVTDCHEDAATMAAEAILELFNKNKLNPKDIGRIYLGTESALDGAKPTATYAVGMVEAALTAQYGERSLRRCDVVDLTFACIGATDALQNCIDWVRGDQQRQAIVIASDMAKYELESTGEYTQGAGAIAILVKHNPRILAVSDTWGVSMESVHDFFKPRRAVSKEALVSAILHEVGMSEHRVHSVLESLSANKSLPFSFPDKELNIFRETPVFDGQYSNNCYLQRALEALEHFGEQVGTDNKTPIYNRWLRMIFHLPYAAHARRIGVDIFLSEMTRIGQLADLEADANISLPTRSDFEDSKSFEKAKNGYMKAVSETEVYRQFVEQKLAAAARASSQVGNVYTASVFLALMSALELETQNEHNAVGQKYGFVAYGSGSKSKVFEATLQPAWKDAVAGFRLFGKLDTRQQISFEDYQNLHTGHIKTSLSTNADAHFKRISIGDAGDLEGARQYGYSILL
jgi:hydroxymethylglutaryl-CoA synthase